MAKQRSGQGAERGSAKRGSAERGSVVARLRIDVATARRIMDAFAEMFDPEAAASSAYETPDGSWHVAIHFDGAPDEDAVRDLVGLAAGAAEAAAIIFEDVAAKDWVKASLEGLAPVEAGRFLVHGAHDRARVPPNRIGIEIEAALAFGTGHHGTTRGCLLALDRILKQAHPRRRDRCRKPEAVRILDLGTGSGVLAIAAAKALRRPVLASDIDALAVTVAHQNAALNHVGALVRTMRADGVTARDLRAQAPFRLAFANILLPPLRRLACPLAALLAPGAHLVLSGLLPAHGNAAIAAYRAQGLVLERRLVVEGWVTLILRRPGRRAGGPCRRPVE